MGFPVVMKVVGPLHKSDAGGVVLDVEDSGQVAELYERMIRIKDCTAILIQPMLKGMELFAGLKKEGSFGHLILCGLGGIFVETLKDISTALTPLGEAEAHHMIRRLKAYPLIQGDRGRKGINESAFRTVLLKLSQLAETAPEIEELDLNPLLGNSHEVLAVDARVRISAVSR
jgi:acetyltransferase